LLQATFRDPEGMFHVARRLTYLGEEDKALQMLGRSVDSGFFCYPAMVRDPWLDPLRGLPEFTGFLHKAQERQREAIRSFVSLGGDALLGMHAESY